MAKEKVARRRPTRPVPSTPTIRQLQSEIAQLRGEINVFRVEDPVLRPALLRLQAVGSDTIDVTSELASGGTTTDTEDGHSFDTLPYYLRRIASP